MSITFTDNSGERRTVPNFDALMAAIGRADEGEVFKLSWDEIYEVEARERRASVLAPRLLSTQEEEADIRTLNIDEQRMEVRFDDRSWQ